MKTRLFIFRNVYLGSRLGHIRESYAGLAASYLRIVFMSIHDKLCISGHIEADTQTKANKLLLNSNMKLKVRVLIYFVYQS